MKSNLMIAIACALPFGAVIADETPPLVVTGSSAFVQMSETELDTVRGGGYGDICFICYENNTAVVTQLNLSLASFGVAQYNESWIDQNNN